ncbi:MAG: exported protein of unknown function [Parcubacteria group bacterium Gr01-1014_30]|nr:MAG: exported protein of unknown function [Parcubacteria group bacterium Gr01-1014_30]
MTLATLRNKRLLLILIIFLASFFFFDEIEACSRTVQGGGQKSCEEFPPGNHHITSAFADWTIDGGNDDSGYFVICAGPPGGGSDAQCHTEAWSDRGAWSGGWTLTDGSPGNWTWAKTDVVVSLLGANFVQATSVLGINTAQPSVDIGCNFQNNCTIANNTSATLQWFSSGNPWSCSASGDWSGGKPLSGSESTGNLTSSRTYSITCSNPTGSNSDSTTVTVGAPPPPPPVSCSPSSSGIIAGSSATFTAAGGNGSYSWSAPGGSPSSGTGSSFTATYTTSGTYYITVSSAGQSDICTLGVTTPPPTCGNGVRDPGEACDNGASNGACPRTCSSVCTVNDCGGGGGGGGGVCGDGVVNSGEQCDLGSGNGACPSTCSSTCTNNSCTAVVSCIDDSFINFISPPPSSVTPGQVMNFSVGGLNTGNTRWWHPSVYAIEKISGGVPVTSTTNEGGCSPGTIDYAPVCFDKFPGDSQNWTFSITAPVAPGDYSFQMRMVHAPTVGAIDAIYLKPDGTTCPAPAVYTYFGNTLSSTINVSSPSCSGGIDVGLRIRDNGQTRAGAVKTDLTTSKLRIYKNNTIYAVVLVDPGSSEASRMNVRVDGQTRALCLLP